MGGYRRAYFAGLASLVISTSGLLGSAVPLTLEHANKLDCPEPVRVQGYLPCTTPESQGISSAVLCDWIAALDRDVCYVHAFVVLKNGHCIAEGAWAPHSTSDRHSLYGLNGLFFSDMIGRNSCSNKREGLPDQNVLALLRAKDVNNPCGETELFWRLANASHNVPANDLLYLSRRLTTCLGFSWEGGASAGDGLGRRTSARNLALLGELHLRGGQWYGMRLLSKKFADGYYRFISRSSGLKVSYGERGQLLMVSPEQRLVVAITADTAEVEKVICVTESILLKDGGRSGATHVDLKKAIAGLKLETCGEVVSPANDVPFDRTFDLLNNRYGYKSLRLSKPSAKVYVVELGARNAQIVKFTSNPSFHDVVFADDEKSLLALNGQYRVSLTGGFVTARRFRAILDAVDTAARFVWEIDFTDVKSPVFTISRHGETKAVKLIGKPAETIAGVKRVQPRAEIIWTHPIYKSHYIGWPTVCCRKNGEVLAAFSGNREGHICPYGRSELVRSSDNGETWTTKSSIIHNDIVDDRDTSVIELKNGDLVAKWFGSTCCEGAYSQMYCKLPRNLVDAARGEWTKRSIDGGRTWTNQAPQVGHAPHGPTLLRDGRLLQFGVASVRQDMWNKTNYPERKSGFIVEESTDDGRSWHRLAFVDPKPPLQIGDFLEPHLIECRDGRLLVMLRTGMFGCTAMIDSTDGGKTWGKIRESPIRITGHPPHLSHTSSGKILLSHADRAKRENLVYISDDDGRGWDVKNVIHLSKCVGSDFGYTSTAELRDGTFLSVYYSPELEGEHPCLMATKWRLR